MLNAQFVSEVVELTNNYRSQNGLKPLSIDIDLTEAAQAHVEDMALNDYFSHYGLNGSRPWDRTDAAGYESGVVGENIGVGYRTPAAIVNGWINSDSHRAAMLNPRYNEIGVGYFFLENDTGDTNYNTYWAQVFGQGEIETSTASVQTLSASVPSSFDPIKYAASNLDLLQVFGPDPTALTQHYTSFGASEGRSIDSFDAMGYLASYSDLLSAFGVDVKAATQHFVAHGHAEGRDTDLFQPLQYLASYDDLINTFGLNFEAATQHFVAHGHAEGRDRDRFDEARYLASNPDLIQHFGYALEAATQHYVQYGMAENRSKDSFDPEGYLNRYSDLQAAFGDNVVAATQHYIAFGFAEGRSWA